MKRRPWDSDWYQYIHQLLTRRGCDSMTEFCDEYPRATYKELATALGPKIAPAQIEILLKREAIENFKFSRFARASLVRYLYKHMPEGWPSGDQTNIQRAAAYSSWASGLGSHYSDSIRKVRERFKTIEIPDGWLPDGPEDPLIQSLFRGIPFHYEETG